MKKEKVDLIIFDLDGTLVDSRKDIANAVNYTLTSFGLKEKSLAEITSYVGWGVADLIRRSLGKENGHAAEKALAVFMDYFREHSTENSVLYPHVLEVLEYFREKRKVIATNRNREFAVLALKNLGIFRYFEDIVGGDDVGCAKPSSCPLDNIVERLKVDRKNAMIVGDMDLDVLSGKSAGMKTCAVTYGFGRKEDIEKAGPDYIIDSMAELKCIIE